MAEPSGHKFGQRIWVLIQVDASLKEDNATCESPQILYFGPPPENTANPNPVKAVTPTADQNQKIDIGDLNLPIDNVDSCIASASLASSSVSPLVCTDNLTPPISSPVSQSVVDCDLQPSSAVSFDLNPRDSSANSSEVEDENSKPEQDDGKNEDEKSNPEKQDEEKNAVEEYLLKEIEEMGFNQIDLNKEVLRGNEYGPREVCCN